MSNTSCGTVTSCAEASVLTPDDDSPVALSEFSAAELVDVLQRDHEMVEQHETRQQLGLQALMQALQDVVESPADDQARVFGPQDVADGVAVAAQNHVVAATAPVPLRVLHHEAWSEHHEAVSESTAVGSSGCGTSEATLNHDALSMLEELDRAVLALDHFSRQLDRRAAPWLGGRGCEPETVAALDHIRRQLSRQLRSLNTQIAQLQEALLPLETKRAIA